MGYCYQSKTENSAEEGDDSKGPPITNCSFKIVKKSYKGASKVQRGFLPDKDIFWPVGIAEVALETLSKELHE